MRIGDREFREVWCVDFEFGALAGEEPEPRCMVARRVEDGHTLRLWRNELQETSPFSTDADSLLIAYYASAELGCFQALGWTMPANVLDLFTEFRNLTNGISTPCGAGLLGAMAYFGMDGLAAADKESMRDLALRGGHYTDDERKALVDYCETDVVALEKLLLRMQADIDLPRALWRGRYMAAAADIETRGVPIDLPLLDRLRGHWQAIQGRLIDRIDADYDVYEGRTFKAGRWAAWLAANDIPWPRLPSGALAMDDDTFREMSRSHPAVAPIRELRVSLSQMRLSELAVGTDGRNRCMLSAFRSRTGRNQPSNTKFIFGPAVWLRSLIQADPGWSVAYVDWSQQEFGIAAALSGDAAMIAAYESGDPYLAFAKQAGAVPPDGTRETHTAVREQFKACVLAVQYGMGADALGARINQAPAVARDLLRRHRENFRKFWEWSDAAVSCAMLRGVLHTAFGWTIHTGPDVNPRMLSNYPMQANGAEMLRLACIAATSRGVRVCAPVHDAILIEAPTVQIQDAVRQTQEAMADASAAVLGGFRLRTDAKVFDWPDRYSDARGARMWEAVQAILSELGNAPRDTTHGTPTGTTGGTPVQSYSLSYMYRVPPDVEIEPRSIPAADPSGAETETLCETATTQRQRAIPQRTDPVGLVVCSLMPAGSGARAGRQLVAVGGSHPKAFGQGVLFGPDDDARQQTFGEASTASTGTGGAGGSGTTAWPVPGGHNPECLDLSTLSDNQREDFEERAGIMQFQALMSRREAESAAFSLVTA